MKKIDMLWMGILGILTYIYWKISGQKLPVYCQECEEPNKPESKECSKCGSLMNCDSYGNCSIEKKEDTKEDEEIEIDTQ